jgi:hypothetical protein
MTKYELSSSQWWRQVSVCMLCSWSLQALLLITVVFKFVPFVPKMPAGGVDPSWAFGLNQAVAQGMAFGRDIIYTFGPYASIYTRLYHPATDHIMLTGSFYLGLSYGFALLLLARGSRWYLLAIFWVVLTGLVSEPSSLFFSYPLLVGAICFSLINTQQNIWVDDTKGTVLIIVLFSPFGLLTLIKGSFVVLCAAVAALVVSLFLFSRKWAWAIAVVASIFGSLFFFWIASGQSVSDLFSYFWTMIPIISGYTEAMSKNGSGREIACYLVASIALLGAVFLGSGSNWVLRYFSFSLFSIYLFVALKSGFVRHDGHAAIAGSALLIASLIFSFTFRTRWSLVLILLCLFVWRYIDSHAVNSSWQNVASRISSTYLSSLKGLGKRSEGNSWLESRFDRRVGQLNETSMLPLFLGTTDIYSNNQSYLIASGNNWNPRPVFQSYTAYTSELARRNNNHLLGQKAPDNIVFSIEPIDKHMPSTEDGLSWYAILNRYVPSALENSFLYLHKKGDSQIESQRSTRINEGTYAFGDVVPVPHDQSLIVAEIAIEKNTLGKLADILFKTDALKITLNLESGASRTYRIVPGMAEVGFLVSPLIESTVQFGRLFGDINALSDKKVQSFSIAPVRGSSLWESRFEVVFKKAVAPPPIDISKLYNFDAELGGLEGYKISIAKKCDGNVDSVNGTSPAPQRFSATNILEIEGWLATSASEGLLPDSVLVVLRDEKGMNRFIETRDKTHPWAAKHFKKPELELSGYTSIADVSRISGNYSLGLAFVEGDHIKICPQFNIPATLGGVPF